MTMDRQANFTAAISDLDTRFLQSSLWPAVLYTVILMIVGTVGNTLVLVVYRRHFQRNATRMFIYALAILDLGNCLITMPAELTILIRFTTFPSPVWCKVTRYLTYIFNGTSSIVLIAIALDRYFKVCRPMTTIITVPRAKIICVASFFLTAILSVPSLLIYGEIHLPVLVSDNGVSLLSLTGNYTPSSAHPHSLLKPASRSFSNRQTRKDGYTKEIHSLGSAGSTNNIVFGRFCLLNAQHIDGKIPLLFYISIFTMYVVMVVLVIAFYGKVARTMFTLTSRHTKMFSFHSHRNCTPSSNSIVPEGSDGHFLDGVSNNVVNEISEADNKTKGSSSASPCGGKSKEEESKTKATAKHSCVQEINGDMPDCIQQGNTGETGYDTGDTSSNSETKPGGLCLYQEESTSKDTLIRNCDQEVPGTKSCDNVAGQLNDSENVAANTAGPQESSSLRYKTLHQKSPSADDINPKSTDKKNKKQKRTSKIPKIKVQKTSAEDCDLDDSHHNLEPQHSNPDLNPLSTNSLLRRRIKSAENLNHLSRLQMLHVPDGRVRGPWIPDIVGTNNLRTSLKQSSRRDNPAGVGHVTTSCVNLDYITDVANPSTNQEKTLALKKTSSIGKKTLCVLPLRGMTTKTASQVRDHQMAHLATSDKSLDSTKSGGTCKSDSKLEPAEDPCQERHLTTRSTPGNLNSHDLDSVVTLRNRTPDIVKSASQPEFSAKSVHVQIKTSRKEIVSAADILQEQHRRGSLHPFRTSRMLFVISLIFVISFLPFFVIALTRSSIGSSFMSLSERELGVLSVFIRSSFINNAANPIAYGFLSTHFRRECMGIMCCIFRS